MDSSEDLQRALKKRVETSGQWIVHEPVFRNLVNLHLRGVESSVAWIYGAPGSGKSVLSASVVQHLQHQLAHQEDAVLAYFFCDTRDKQKKSILAIVRSLIAQILTQLKATPSSLSTAYENAMKYGRSRISSTDQPLMLVKSLATSLSATFIVLDGLDECDDPSEVAQSFADVACLSETVRLVCFSRESTALKARLGQFPSLKLTAALTKPDIDNYLSTAVMELPTDEASTRKEVFEKLSRDADGMFLWAHLMVQNLKSATNTKEILEMLAELPVGLDVVYDFILQRLSKESSRRRMLVRKIYSWVCCSTRSLSWSELQCALALDRDDSSLLGSRRPFKSAVLELCRPLIEYNPSSDVFRPAHLSVQEFLMGRSQSFGISQEAKQFFIEEEIAHREIAELCLTYVSCTELANAVNVDPQRFPLADYATMHWCHHLSSSPADSALYQKVTQFLSSPCRRRTWITRSLLSKETAFPLQKIMRLQRLVRGWTSTISEEPICPIDEIGDIQQALLDLDQYQELDSKPDKPLRQSVGKISSFERLMAFRDLAREFTMSGRLDDGVSWLMKSLKRVQQLQGPASVETAWLLNSLGILYDQQGKIDLALQTQREALTIQESWLPCDHFDTTMTINELGRIYRHLGCYGEAEAMHLRALQALQKSLPDDDLQIVWTLNTLARSYRKQGRVSEAIELHNQALAGQSQHLGREHPHTLWTMTDLGRCYRDQGRLLEAYDVQQKAIGLRTKVLGAHHADTLWSINDLGIVLEQLGQFVEAERVHTLALQGQALTLGESNKHTDWTRQALTRLKIRIAVEPDTHSLEPSST